MQQKIDDLLIEIAACK